MKISSISDLFRYLSCYSNFSSLTIRSVIAALGYDANSYSLDEFKELSGVFKDCSEHGADDGFSGFSYYRDTIAFFKANRKDIITHMEQTAAELGTDIISLVQGFGVFRNSDKPTPSEVGRALWDSGKYWPELNTLYNVFAWYALEEVSRTWYGYLETHPAYRAGLST